MNEFEGKTNLGFKKSNSSSLSSIYESLANSSKESLEDNLDIKRKSNLRKSSSDCELKVLPISCSKQEISDFSKYGSSTENIHTAANIIESGATCIINPVIQSVVSVQNSSFKYITSITIIESNNTTCDNHNNIQNPYLNPAGDITCKSTELVESNSCKDKMYTSRFNKTIIKILNNQWTSLILKYFVTYPLLIAGIWALLYIFWGKDAFPGGSFFALIALEVLAISLGQLAELVSLPPFLGMLSAGLILRNVPYINVATDLKHSISSPLRGISVVILLTRGAFSVNPANIKKFKKVIPSLALGSCITEAIFGSISSYFIIGFPPEWAALMGCILSAMSGVAVMPYLMDIEKCLTVPGSFTKEKAKESLIIAKTACGLDAILAICMAECALGFIFGEGVISTSLLKGLGEVMMGGLWGIFWGGATGLLLDKKYPADFRVIALFSGGVMSLLGLSKITYPRGGPLGTFLGSLIAINIWRYRETPGIPKISSAFDKLWFLFQPLLFGILGARSDFALVNWRIVYQGAICLLISITSRMIASFFMSSFSNLSFRERLFLVIVWLPKGTVQAALGPVALDTSIELGLNENYKDLANNVMNVAAITIILAGFLGSIVLKFLGPQFLILNR